jgi:hypothetical protein
MFRYPCIIRSTAIDADSGCPGQDDLLKGFGKFKMGKGCIFIKKLSDIDRETLKKLTKTTIEFLQMKYGQ